MISEVLKKEISPRIRNKKYDEVWCALLRKRERQRDGWKSFEYWLFRYCDDSHDFMCLV